MHKSSASQQRSDPLQGRVEHHDVYREKGEFAGWPANYGLWIWDDEVVVVFAQGLLGESGDLHARDREHPFRPRQARSQDGGLTWSQENFNGLVPGGSMLSADEHVVEGLRMRPHIDPDRDLLPLDTPIDFLDPETIVMAARTGLGEHSLSWFYVSRDRARTWQGPYAFGDMGLSGIAARTDIIALDTHDALFMLTAPKSDGAEGRVFCARTTDGGRTFRFESFVSAETEGYAIMPASVRLENGAILTIVRRMGGGDNGWLEAYLSDDVGESWTELGRPVGNTGFGGNPPALALLTDGRLVLTYGYRDEPFGMRARVSNDGGRTWDDEIRLRTDAGVPDLGYPRLVQRPDGTLLTVYYFNQGEHGERFIAGTIFDVPA